MNALQIATQAHAGQFRRDGVTPYIEHPLAVAAFFEKGSLAWEVALLHDTVEDERLTFEQLESFRKQGFIQENTITFVRWLTHRQSETYFDYIKRVAKSPIAVKVKIADIFANLSDSPTEKQKEKYKKALAILLQP